MKAQNVNLNGLNMALLGVVVIMLAFVAVYLQMLLFNGAVNSAIPSLNQISYWQMWGVNVFIYFISLFRYVKVN